MRGCERVDVKRPAPVAPAAAVPAPPAPPGPAPLPPPPPTLDFPNDHELIAAGDIAGHETDQDGNTLPNCAPQPEQTAKLVDTLSGPIALPGDAVYEVGSTEEYEDCYAASWGRFKSRTRPVAGDHDYKTPGAAGFFGYFGASAGDPAKGWYSYEVGTWHVVALNSNCDQIGGCGLGSPEEAWLRADLAAHPKLCTLAYWHTPLYSSGSHGNIAAVKPLWQALYDNGAELVLNGHDHDYERFAPQNAAGALDTAKGIREFIVGTGGRYLRSLDATHQPNSEAANDTTFGVLDLKLNALGYDWHFVPVPGSSFTDSGSGTCH